MDPETKAFLQAHRALEYTTGSNKVRCSLTGHEMPCRLQTLRDYVTGKKYLKASAKENCTALDQYRDQLEPSHKKNRKNQLFCKLTWRHLNNDPTHIEKHVAGKRFKRALEHFEDCKLKGVKFKPLSGLYGMKPEKEKEEKKFSKSAEPSDSELDGNETSEDDMEDLYPAKDFNMAEEEDEGEASDKDDSEFEFEDLEAMMAAESEGEEESDVEGEEESSSEEEEEKIPAEIQPSSKAKNGLKRKGQKSNQSGGLQTGAHKKQKMSNNQAAKKPNHTDSSKTNIQQPQKGFQKGNQKTGKKSNKNNKNKNAKRNFNKKPMKGKG